MGKEIFKSVTYLGFRDIYEVSNKGTVRRIDTSKIMMLNRNGGSNYLCCRLSIPGMAKQFYAHRLVATAFIDNPCNKPQVNHINGIKHDNRSENLEWVTNGENLKHAYDNGMRNGSSLRKKVINIKTGFIHSSIASASKETTHNADYFSKILRGIHKNTTDFIFYEE